MRLFCQSFTLLVVNFSGVWADPFEVEDFEYVVLTVDQLLSNIWVFTLCCKPVSAYKIHSKIIIIIIIIPDS